MGKFIKDEYGSRWFIDEDGNMSPSPTGAGIAEFAGQGLQSIGGGIQGAYAELTGNEALAQRVQDESAARQQLMAGAAQESPIASAVGRALPGLATAPLSAGGLAGWAGINMGLGALESALDVDQAGNWAQRATAGAIGGALGDLGGRLVGRVMKGAGAITEALAGRKLQGNAAAQAFEGLGGETMAYQRLAPESMAQRFAERFSQGAEISPFGSQLAKRTRRFNDELYKDTVADAVGVDGRLYDDLGEDFVNDALTKLEDGFEEVARKARSTGDMALNPSTAKALQNSNQVSKLRKLGEFQGLDSNKLTGSEWVTARQALAEDAASAFKLGDGEVGKRYAAMVGELDQTIKGRLPPEYLPEFAKLREQYRVMSIIERPNVIGSNKQINTRSLQRALNSKAQGFGRTASRGQAAVNPETDRLLQLSRAGDQPEFAAFKSSGTTENAAAQAMIDQATSAAGGLAQGDPTNAAGMLMSSGMGNVLQGGVELGGGLPYNALFGPQGLPGAAKAGGAVGRSLLDEAFYPFVGADDDRQR